MAGVEGEGPRGKPTSQQSKPTEQHKPHQEGGNGSPGLPPLPERAKPPPESRERQPLPSVLDILEHRAQLYESKVRDLYQRHHESKHNREYLALYREHRGNVEQLGDEAARLYAEWSDRDRHIFDLYTTSVEWRFGLSTQKTQEFIARIQPMSEDELREELRSAREAAEQKAARYKKMAETQRRNRSLTAEERWKRYKEEEKRRGQRNYLKRKEERTLQAERQQSTQVFPDPTQE